MAKDALDALLANASKKYDLNVGTVDGITSDAKFITTGNIAIDYVLGGGIPIGRTIELAGSSGSGKTTTALQTAVNVQNIIRNGGDTDLGIRADSRILYLDYEHAIDPEYAGKLGLDVNDESFLFTQPDSLEDGAEFCLRAIETGRIALVIVDSVAAMNPKVKRDNEIGKTTIGVAAKLLKEFGTSLNPIAHENNCSVIFINHEYDQIGGYSPGGFTPQITPGGKALKYFASVRLSYRLAKTYKTKMIDPIANEEVERPSSSDIRVKSLKNRLAPPFRESIARVRFGKGFDNYWTAMMILVAHKKVIYAAGIFKFHRVEDIGLAPEWMSRATTGAQAPYIKGQDTLVKAADEHPEWREGIIALAKEVVSNKQEVDVDEEDDDDDESLDNVV